MPSTLSYLSKRSAEFVCTLYYLFSITFRLAFRWHIKYETQFAPMLFLDYFVDCFFILSRTWPHVEAYYLKYRGKRIDPLDSKSPSSKYVAMSADEMDHIVNDVDPSSVGDPGTEVVTTSTKTKKPTEVLLTDLAEFDKEYESYDQRLDEKRRIHSQQVSKTDLFEGSEGDMPASPPKGGGVGIGVMEQEAMKRPQMLCKPERQMSTSSEGVMNTVNLASTRTLLSKRFDPSYVETVDKFKRIKASLLVVIEVLSIFPFEIIGFLVGLHNYYTILRAFRLLRLWWVMQYWGGIIEVLAGRNIITGSSAKRVLFLTMFMFVLAHCGACVFFAIGLFEIERHVPGYGNWMQFDGIVEVGAYGETVFTKGVYYIYVRALYWSVVTSVRCRKRSGLMWTTSVC